MMRRPQIAMLPDGRRLHLQDGPIDLIVEAFGSADAVRAAYEAAAARFHGLLDDLCAELAALRTRAARGVPTLEGAVAQRMVAAVSPFAAETFITPHGGGGGCGGR